MWIEDEQRARVCLDIKQITGSEDVEPDLKPGGVAQVVGEHQFKGRIGKVRSVYWTNSRAGGKQPRWVALMEFKRGNFPIKDRLMAVALLENLP